MYFSGNWVPKLNSWRSLKLQNTRLGLDWTNASPTKNSYRISYRILNFLYKFGRICNRSKFPTGRLASPIFIFRSAPQLKVHIPKCTVNKSFPSYSYLIAFFCSLFNLILKPFPSSICKARSPSRLWNHRYCQRYILNPTLQRKFYICTRKIIIGNSPAPLRRLIGNGIWIPIGNFLSCRNSYRILIGIQISNRNSLVLNFSV